MSEHWSKLDLPERLRVLADIESAALSPQVSPIGQAAYDAADEIEWLRDKVRDQALELVSAYSQAMGDYK